MKTPILGGSYEAFSLNLAANRCLNMYLEMIPDGQGGKVPGALRRAPGKRLLATIGPGPIRGLRTVGNALYVASGPTLYKVNTVYSPTTLGSISGVSRRVSMSDNGTQLMVVTNPDGYIYNTSTAVFAQITDADWPGASMVDYVRGYFVFIEPDSQRFWITSLLDGTAIDPTEFETTTASPDTLVSLIVDHEEALLFGEKSVEFWAYSGAADFPFSKRDGVFIEHGCIAAASPSKIDNTVYWLGQDEQGKGTVWKAQGYTPVRVSTHALETALEGYNSLADGLGYAYQQEGHSFYVLSFPAAHATWVLDIATGFWHERAYRVPATDQLEQDRATCHAMFNGLHVVGDNKTGNLYALDNSTYADGADPQKWIRSWRALPTGKNNLKRVVHHRLDIDLEAGVGINSGQGSAPVIQLRWSDDGGHTWSNGHDMNMGAMGKYKYRAWRSRLGASRDRVYELSGTDPVKLAILGAELSASAGAS